jgi:hypothetical protein
LSPASLPAQTWLIRDDPLSGQQVSAGAAMTYDLWRDRTVLFGNHGPNPTWEYDGRHWTRVATTTSPPVQSPPALAYDILRGRTVLFGGTVAAETWEYDGTNWTLIPTTSRRRRWDPSRRHLGVRRREMDQRGHDVVSAGS